METFFEELKTFYAQETLTWYELRSILENKELALDDKHEVERSLKDFLLLGKQLVQKNLSNAKKADLYADGTLIIAEMKTLHRFIKIPGVEKMGCH